MNSKFVLYDQINSNKSENQHFDEKKCFWEKVCKFTDFGVTKRKKNKPIIIFIYPIIVILSGHQRDQTKFL